jgi:DNA-binding NarL/FixJ family response regulator
LASDNAAKEAGCPGLCARRWEGAPTFKSLLQRFFPFHPPDFMPNIIAIDAPTPNQRTKRSPLRQRPQRMEKMGKIRILIIDDHPLFREGLKAIVARDPRFKVVGEAGTGREGLEMVGELSPDVAVVDISLPDTNGLELASRIRRQYRGTRILIISMHSKIDYIVEAFQAGATGYVVKESAAERLVQGLEAVASGEYFLDSSISHEVIEKLMKSPVKEARISDAEYGTLTPREQEIMRYLAEGIPKKEIAKRLFISPKTVENHRANIMRKLNIHSAMELVRYAARLGLIDVDLWKE